MMPPNAPVPAPVARRGPSLLERFAVLSFIALVFVSHFRFKSPISH